MVKRLKVVVVLLVLVAVFSSSCAGPQRISVKQHPDRDVYPGWRLGMQIYSFREFTFFEAVDKTASLGLDWIESYPGQRFSADRSDMKFHHTMSVQMKTEAKKKLKDTGIKMVNYGVVSLPNDETECRKIFDFAKEMGIETIVSEPSLEAMELVDRLCQEYKIKMGIHNHPKPSKYWHPDSILTACKGRSKWVGASPDVGHWLRCGVNPVDGLKKLEGRIISLHFKDINDEHEDVIWGRGKCDVRAMLIELDRQKFKGVFSNEYEANWKNSVPDIRRSTEYFDKVAAELKPTGWTNLLTKGLSNFTYKPGSWILQDGTLARNAKSYIWTKKQYGNFILDLEFKVAKKTNSGIFFRTADIKDCVQTGIEVQIFDSYGREPGRHSCGAIYDCLAPSKNTTKKPGLWNRMTIICRDNKINVVMNGRQIIDMDMNKWTEPRKNPDGTKNKFKTAYKNMPRRGYIGFQDHGDPVWYRNIRIKSLDK
ncbi:MAG: family 16 glycoside hydrolase [Planctomycetota bacterium]|jgi:sugar phosphate isomerase/epimerase